MVLKMILSLQMLDDVGWDELTENKQLAER